MERLKVLFVIDHLGGGGAERQFLNLVNNLDRERFEPHVFLAEKQGARFDELDRAVEVHGLTDGGKRRTAFAMRSLRTSISRIAPHIIQSWLDYSTFLTAVILMTVRLHPIFIASHRTSTEELYGYEVRFGRLKRSLLIWAYKQADKVTTNSKFLMRQLEGYGVGKVQVIYNGIDLETLYQIPPREKMREKLGLDPSLFYVCFVGSLVERKGIEYLIEASKSIKSNSVRILISGDGELKKRVERAAAEDSRLIFLGYRPNAVEYTKASDLLVLPSIYEGLPNVILEAMAVGTPVLATNVYGVPELIQDNVNGLLVHPRNADLLQMAIERIMDNPGESERFAEASRARIDFFAVPRMTQEYERLYEQCWREHENSSPRLRPCE